MTRVAVAAGAEAASASTPMRTRARAGQTCRPVSLAGHGSTPDYLTGVRPCQRRRSIQDVLLRHRLLRESGVFEGLVTVRYARAPYSPEPPVGKARPSS